MTRRVPLCHRPARRWPQPGGSTLLTDHDITEELATAFHDRADPVRATAVDPAGIFPRGVRARQRRTAVRAAAVATGVALAAAAAISVAVPGTSRPEVSGG